MDAMATLGLLLGLLALALGHWIEGGHLASLLQPAAALIVFGGTLGATLLAVPAADLRCALALLGRLRTPAAPRAHALVSRMAQMADVARKEGVMALENALRGPVEPVLRGAAQQLVDGTPAQLLRERLETELSLRMERELAGARVFEAAGGYAPTIGILGAVLGLMHVMQNLTEPEQLGAGIAVAFVATVYGVGFANLVCLPLARRLRRVVDADRLIHEMVIEGALAIQAAESARTLRERLRPYLGDTAGRGGG